MHGPHLAILQAKDQLDSISIDGLLRDLRSHPALRLVRLPRLGANIIIARHGGQSKIKTASHTDPPSHLTTTSTESLSRRTRTQSRNPQRQRSGMPRPSQKC